MRLLLFKRIKSQLTDRFQKSKSEFILSTNLKRNIVFSSTLILFLEEKFKRFITE